MTALLLCVVAISFWVAESIQLPPVVQDAGIPKGLGSEACNTTLRSDKEFDLVIYGATGFTGQLAAKYLSAGLPGAPRWAIGGRKKADLASIRSKLADGGSQLGPTILVADLQNLEALQAMTQRTKVVLTFAGPYEQYGAENLIKAALSTCTDYVDITGEVNWMLEMMRKYGDEARARGLAVVQSAGFDALPADLIAMLVAEEVAADGQGPPSDVAVLWSKSNGWRSGGTAASGAWQSAHYSPLGPYGLAPGATQVSPDRAAALFEEEEQFEYWGTGVDLPVIHRSMSMRFPGAGISVAEASGAGLYEEFQAFAADPRMESDPPPEDPQPGEGPPEWMLEEGSFAAEARARRSADGRMAAIRLDGAGDPGYQSCAKFSVEFALALAREGPAVAGFPTPSLALGPTRLREILELADGGRLMNFTAA